MSRAAARPSRSHARCVMQQQPALFTCRKTEHAGLLKRAAESKAAHMGRLQADAAQARTKVSSYSMGKQIPHTHNKWRLRPFNLNRLHFCAGGRGAAACAALWRGSLAPCRGQDGGAVAGTEGQP